MELGVRFFREQHYSNGVAPLFIDYLLSVPRIKWLPETMWGREALIDAHQLDIQRYVDEMQIADYNQHQIERVEESTGLEVYQS